MSGISQAVGLVTSLPSHLEIKIFEKKSSLGGVWRDALWPGAGESHQTGSFLPPTIFRFSPPPPCTPLVPPYRRTLIALSPLSSPSLTEIAFLCPAGVDVPIHLYSLYSDPKADWTTTYAEQPEVLAYYDGLVDKYHLRGNFAFDTEYVGSEWHDSTQSHTLTLRRSDGSTYTHEAEIIISANGLCSPFPFFPYLFESTCA